MANNYQLSKPLQLLEERASLRKIFSPTIRRRCTSTPNKSFSSSGMSFKLSDLDETDQEETVELADASSHLLNDKYIMSSYSSMVVFGRKNVQQRCEKNNENAKFISSKMLASVATDKKLVKSPKRKLLSNNPVCSANKVMNRIENKPETKKRRSSGKLTFTAVPRMLTATKTKIKETSSKFLKNNISTFEEKTDISSEVSWRDYMPRAIPKIIKRKKSHIKSSGSLKYEEKQSLITPKAVGRKKITIPKRITIPISPKLGKRRKLI